MQARQHHPVRQAEAFLPTWDSLRMHSTPRWLIDAKFGVYCHWGLGSIQQRPGCEDWSPQRALKEFTAEGFDPETWADLFVHSGAKFAGPIAWHGSPLLHWDSAIDEFNTVRQNPRRDIVGELFAAIRRRGLKTFASFHSISNDGWLERACEAVSRYHPDVFWVDASFGGTKQAHHLKIVNQAHYLGGDVATADGGEANPGHHPAGVLEQLADEKQRTFLAYLFNDAIANDHEVAFAYKSYDIPPGVGVRDLENGFLGQMAYDVWMTDVDMNLVPDWNVHGWFHREDLELRSAESIVHRLVDVVSKNGVFLLNAPPLPDGSFSEDVRSRLEAVGRWLAVNGEAIYGTSPWSLFGEGPTIIEPLSSGSFHHNDHFGNLSFTAEDIRFTVKGDVLYATCLGTPDGPLTIQALSTAFKIGAGAIKDVKQLGKSSPIGGWTHDERGLTIPPLSEAKLETPAVVFRIALRR